MTFANYESIDPNEQDLARMSNHSVYPSNSITTSFNKRQDEPEKPKSSLPPQSSPEKTPTSKTTTTTMTDSGITHTIPNDNPVTVTMHTTITQGMSTSTPPTNATKPETAQTSAIDGASGAVSPSTTSSAPGEPGNDGNKDISTGAVVGIAISGAIVFVVLCILFFMWRRRKRNGTQYSDSTHQETTTSQEAVLGEKDYPWPLSNTRHSSHHAGRANHSSGDPFGPFGGRADKPFDPYRPPSNTFEMDGVDTAVTELPAAAPDSEPKAEQSNESAAKRTPTGPVDPRATLSDLRNEDGGPAYVNQWNQYVVLARQRDGDSKQGEF